MKRVELSEHHLAALFWLRSVELKCPRWKLTKRLCQKSLWSLIHRGIGHHINLRRTGDIFGLTAFGRGLFNEIVQYEEDNPRFSANEGPSAVLYRDALYSWSHLAAVREIEDMRRMRLGKEIRTAKASGRKGCAKTRLRAEPRPKVAVCVDDCRNSGAVR